MKRSCRRRVQAQRKFAQGALIPTPAPEANQPTTPPTFSATDVRPERLYQCKTSACTLLDMVSYGNLHTHKVPIVMIERLPDNNTIKTMQKETTTPKKVKRRKRKAKAQRAPKIPEKDTSFVSDDERPLKYLKVAQEKPAATLKEPAVSKPCTRSSHLLNKINDPNKNPLMNKSSDIGSTEKIVQEPTNMNPQNPISRDESRDMVTLKELAAVSKPCTRSSHQLKKIHDPNKNPLMNKSSDIGSTEKIVQEPTNMNPQNPISRDESRDMVTLKELAAVSKPCTRSSHQLNIIHDPNQNPLMNKSSDIGSTEKIVQEPTNMNPQNPISRDESRDTVNDVMVPIPDINTIPYLSSKLFDDTIKTKSVSIASSSISGDPQNNLYGDVGIKQWMEGRPASKDWEAINIKSMSLPNLSKQTPEIPNHDLTNQDSKPPNCQGKACQQCSHCQVANKGKTLRERLCFNGRESQGASADVYNFDAELDEAPPQESYQPRKQRPPPSVASTSYGDDNKLYFDILPPNVPQIIELTVVKIPNSKERKIKARMISRSESPASPKKMSLVEHEIVLDELLKMIPAVNHPQPSNDIFKIPNRPETRSLSKNKGIGKKTRNTDALEPDELMDGSQSQPAEAALAAELPGPSATGTNQDPGLTDLSPPTPTPPPPATRIFQSTNAPTYFPTEKEFNDPIAYFEKIAPAASKFGICKVVSPKSFNPECILDESINFDVSNQYIARLYIRWGPCAREMAAIKACLSPQGVKFKRPPLMAGVELDLPKLYQEVQKRGGLNEVNEKKEWNNVAEAVGCLSLPNPERKLDSIYVKYLVPYETLSHQEREQIKSSVETAWINRNKKLLDWAFNPLQRQKKLLGEAESSESEAEEDDVIVEALDEAEDCVARGRKMTLGAFKNVAQSAHNAFIKGTMNVQDFEAEYWRLVLLGERHVCVNAASIDTGDHGYGFSKGKTPCAKHPWNLKKLSANPGNVLRSLGPVLGVTVPTLHLGMVFSTSCWHRDPHGLPWVEYMHHGSPKIWYGIPNEQSRNFRKAVEALCPTSCQNKSIWLPSDITMIPPNLLREHNVSLSRVVQNPGEYIIVFPKAYSCSISTGFTVSESVYFATNSWLNTVHKVFQELRESCEPTTFSLDQLLISIARDMRAPLSVLPLTHAGLATLVTDELRNRHQLRTMGIPTVHVTPKRNQSDVWNVQEEAECEYCRATLYLSKVTGIADRSSAVCLTHALQMLQNKCGENDVTQLELVLFFTDQGLEDILTKLRNRLT